MNNFDPGILVPIGLAAIFLFFVFRYITLWYLNINKRVELLEKNNQLLEKLVEHFTGEKPKEEEKKD